MVILRHVDEVIRLRHYTKETGYILVPIIYPSPLETRSFSPNLGIIKG